LKCSADTATIFGVGRLFVEVLVLRCGLVPKRQRPGVAYESEARYGAGVSAEFVSQQRMMVRKMAHTAPGL